MKITNRDIGNAMDEEALINLITAIDIEVLRNYRLAVGRNNRLVYGVLLQRVLIGNKRRSYDRKKKLTIALLMGKRHAISIRPEIITILGT